MWNEISCSGFVGGGSKTTTYRCAGTVLAGSQQGQVRTFVQELDSKAVYVVVLTASGADYLVRWIVCSKAALAALGATERIQGSSDDEMLHLQVRRMLDDECRKKELKCLLQERRENEGFSLHILEY